MTATRRAEYGERSTYSDEPITHVNPNSIATLNQVTSGFIEECRSNGGGVMLFSGFEYLMSQNSFESMLRYVQSMNDKLPDSKCRILLPIDPKALKDKEFHLLQKECCNIEEAVEQKSQIRNWGIYLMKDESGEGSYRFFSSLVNQRGCPGACITRRNPRSVMEDYKIENVPMYWLTTNIPRRNST